VQTHFPRTNTITIY